MDGGSFVEANEELAASFGYDGTDALIGTSWTALYPKTERDRIESEVLPQVRQRGAWRGEVRGVRADGTTFPQLLSVRATGTNNDDEELVWIVRDRGER